MENLKELVLQVFVNGGWLVLMYIVFRITIWIIRRTKTQTDDMILDKYVSKAVEFALSVIPNPEKTHLNWLKFTGNALSKFSEAYTKEQGDVPDLSTFEKAKRMITEIATDKEFKNISDLLKEYKNKDKNIA